MSSETQNKAIQGLGSHNQVPDTLNTEINALGIPVVLDETTPLLRCDVTEEDQVDFKHEDIAKTTMFLEECKTIAVYALPVFGSGLLEYSLVFVSVFTLGHLSTTALAAISVATMTANVTGLSMIQGFCSALDTLLPSAWTSDQPQLVGLWAQRMGVMVAVELVLILGLWFNAEGILLALKQDPEIVRLAGQYLRWLSLGMPAYACTCIMRRIFQAQGLFSVPTKLIIIVSPINLLLNYTLVLSPTPFKLGFIGAPISTVICQYLFLFLNLGYAYLWMDRKALHPLTSQTFHPRGLWIVTKLGISGIGQMASEWWAWELVALAASFLGPVALAAQSILMTTEAMVYQLMMGVSAAAGVRIGNLLGEGRAMRAGVATRAAIGVAGGASLGSCALLITFRNSWGAMFNTDPAVVSLVASILPTIALFQITDGNTAVTAAIMRAKGQQFIGAVLMITAYYVIGLPVGIWMAFKAPNNTGGGGGPGDGGKEGWGLVGLWYGLTISLVYTASVGTWIALRTDWEVEVEKVRRRLKAEEEEQRKGRARAGGELEGAPLLAE